MRAWFPEHFHINSAGHLMVGNCDTVHLAERYGTPLYVMDEQHIRSMCQRYLQAMRTVVPDGVVVYAGKALLTTGICRIIEQESLFLDVASGGELFTALRAGFPAERICFHGNNKSREELELALDGNVGRFIVDNDYEMELLRELVGNREREAQILLRITPGVEAHTHSYIQTGQEDSKFGFGIKDNLALNAVEKALQTPGLKLLGLHCHIGSQIFDVKPFLLAIEKMCAFIRQILDVTGYSTEELNIGGGLGIRYNSQDHPPEVESVVVQLATYLKKATEANGIVLPRLLLEPGRSIVGEAGITLYRVGAIKELPSVRKYLAVDGGMGDNPRVALYQAAYSAALANKAGDQCVDTYSVAGKCCESGDMLLWDCQLPPAHPGDLLAVFSTGAYNYSMASNYNRLPRPAIVLVEDGHAEVLVKRETYGDLVSNDLIPSHLLRQGRGSVSQLAGES